MRKLIVSIACLFVLMVFSTLGRAQAQEQPLQNIQVLDKSMTRPQVVEFMRKINADLGVQCTFCHLPNANGQGVNPAPDDKPEKLTARKMIQMVKLLNEQDFFKGGDRKMECYTCHKGSNKIAVAPPTPPPAPARGAAPGR